MPQGHNACPQALGGCVNPGVLLSDVLTDFNKTAISKNLSGGFGKKGFFLGGAWRKGISYLLIIYYYSDIDL